MTGWDVFIELKLRAPETSFAFLSNEPLLKEHWDEMKSAGVCEYITKPFTKRDLIDMIKAITER